MNLAVSQAPTSSFWWKKKRKKEGGKVGGRRKEGERKEWRKSSRLPCIAFLGYHALALLSSILFGKTVPGGMMTGSAECYFLNLCENSFCIPSYSLGTQAVQSLVSGAKCKQDVLSDREGQLSRTHTLCFLPCLGNQPQSFHREMLEQGKPVFLCVL